ncbi:SH3 domain-containing protein [Capnocytophaga bilenii]
MKKNINITSLLTIFYLFVFSNLLSQNVRIAEIQDNDGYTNIREKADIKSKIIGKVLKKELFFYEEYNNSNWVKIKTLNGVYGFIHKSRIKNKNNTNLLIVKVNDYKNDLLKDSILDLKVKLKEEAPPFFIEDFSYIKLNRRENQQFYVLFSNEDINIKIVKKKTNINDYHIKRIKVENREYIDIIPQKGLEIHGVDIDFPKYEIQDVIISSEDNQYNLSKTDIKYLFNPNLERIKVYRKTDKEYIIFLSGGDGVVAYNVIFVVDKQKILYKYILENR